MPGRRSVSVEPEDLVTASPRRRSARIAIRTDSPAPALRKELVVEKSSTPSKRTRRSVSIQEKSLNDIEKDVQAISHHSNSHSASSSNASGQITGPAARRTRRSASTQETHVVPDDVKKDYKPMPLKRSKRLLSKEKSTDVIEEEDNKPEPTDDDAPTELNARKRYTRSMSRSPTNGQKLKTSAPPVVKTFRTRLSTNVEETAPVVLDIITENEDDETDKTENDTSKPTLETDMLNNNAKKFSEDTKMETDETTEDSVGAADEIIKSTGIESEVESSAKIEETVLNTSVTSPTVEETNMTANSTNDIVNKSVTDVLVPSNGQNELEKTESISTTSSSAENMKDPESSDKFDDSVKESVNTEEDISNKELNDANSCEFSKDESEFENKISSIVEKEDNSDLQVDTQIIEDSDVKKKEEDAQTNEAENKLDSTEETIDKLEITQEDEMMDKLEINEDSKDCTDNISISETSLIDTISTNTNDNEDSAKNESSEDICELDESIVAKPSEISIATLENITKETTKIVMEIEETQNKVSEENKDPGDENSQQIEVANVILPEQNLSSNSMQELDVVDEESTNGKEQSVTVDNSVAEQRMNTEISPKKVQEITNTSDSEPVNKNDTISNDLSSEIKGKETDNATNEDDVTNISIVSTDKTPSTVDKCDNDENCDTNISIVDSPDSNISSTPIKDTSNDKSESAGKDPERNLNLSLVNDDGKSYSPIINRIENISVDFEYSTSSIVDSSGAALHEVDVMTKNSSEHDVELVVKDSYQEECDTSFQNQKKPEDSNKSNIEIPKESEIFNENFQSKAKELNNSLKEVNQKDDSSNGNIKEDDILYRSKNDNSSNENITNDVILNKPSRKETCSDENNDLSEEIQSESPAKESNETSIAEAKESIMEPREQSRDKILDDFIQSFKADKKRKRQSSDDSTAETALTQKKRRKHKTELNFSSDSDENSDIVESQDRNISDESEDGYEANEFIDDMASEGSEQTPSMDSNEIIDEGESVGSTDSEIDSDDDYEHGSFVVDDDVGNEELLSGSEDIECWTPKRKRVITIASDSDDELEKMSMEPFGGSSPSLISVNQISSVDSDLESVKCKNEALSKLIEDKAKSDTDEEDVVIVNESINKIDPHDVLQNKSSVEEIAEAATEHKEKIIDTIDNIQQPEDAINNTDGLEKTESSLTEPMNELNTEDEKENLENPDISEEVIVEKKLIDENPNDKEIIEEVFEPEPEICNEVENNIEKESDNKNLANTEKDAKYKAILDKYFKQFDEKISKITRRRTTGMFSNENNDASSAKRKRRQSLETGENKSQNDTSIEDFYNEKKKAKIPINNDEENVFDKKQEETETNKVKKRITDENSQGRTSDAVEQISKKTLKSVKRHSLTNIENIPGKYVQSAGRLNKSFPGYTGSKEIEIIQKYIAMDNTEASMLKDFSDIVKDDIQTAKAYVASPKMKKSYDISGVEPRSEPNNTSDFDKTIPTSPKIPALATSAEKKDDATLKRKKKHSKSVETLVQEELPTSGTKEIEEVYTNIKKKKKLTKLETNEQADKDNLEINVKKKKQFKSTGDIKKDKQGIQLPSTVLVSEINAEETQTYKYSNFSSADYLSDTAVKLTDQKNVNNKKWKQITTSKSFPKNKTRSSPDNQFIVKKEQAIASKSENDEYVSRNINIYKNLIRPSGRGTTGANIKVETLHAASIKIKKEKKKQKYNRSSKTDAPVPKASFTGQTNCCNFKEELLFGNNVKRVAISDILQKKRSLK